MSSSARSLVPATVRSREKKRTDAQAKLLHPHDDIESAIAIVIYRYFYDFNQAKPTTRYSVVSFIINKIVISEEKNVNEYYSSQRKKFTYFNKTLDVW